MKRSTSYNDDDLGHQRIPYNLETWMSAVCMRPMHEICFEKRGGELFFRNKSCYLCWVGQLCWVGLEMLRTRTEVSCPCYPQATKTWTSLPLQSCSLIFHKMKTYRYSQMCKPPLRPPILTGTHVNHPQNTSTETQTSLVLLLVFPHEFLISYSLQSTTKGRLEQVEQFRWNSKL